MEPFFVRYRNLVVLLTVLAAQIIGLAVQVRHSDAGRNAWDAPDGAGVRLIRIWAEGVVAPPERLIHGAKTSVVSLWQNYLDLHRTRQENQDLQRTVDRLRLEQASLLEDAKQGQRLQAMLGFQEKYVFKTVAAQVIGSSGSLNSRVFYVDKGSSDGLQPDQAVMTPDGIVGKVRVVSSHTAQVLMVNDQTSGAGVILETTRIRGILRGNASGQTLVVGILADQRIQPGEKILTAGGDQVFPRGLPVGVVQKVARDPDRDAFILVYVTPAAHIDRLDEVLVITSTMPSFSDEQLKDIATSQALKGPEVEAAKEQAAKEAAAREEQAKEQKRAAELGAERLPGLIDPNLPPEQQPLHDTTPPQSLPHAPQAVRADRFTPGSSSSNTDGAIHSAAVPSTAAPKKPVPPPVGGAPVSAQPGTKPAVHPPLAARPAGTVPSATKPAAKPATAPTPTSETPRRQP